MVRVQNLVEESVWRQRYDEINSWENGLVEQGIVLIKCFLNISSAEQKERLLARLDDPTKHWKYNPGDVDGARKVAGVHGGVRSGPGALQYPARAVVRHPVRSQVVSKLGRGAAASRAPAGPRPALACCRLRCRGREGSGRSELIGTYRSSCYPSNRRHPRHHSSCSKLG